MSSAREAKTRSAERPIEFRSVREMEDWLEENHSSSGGIWLRLYKKGSGVEAVRTGEALEAALCYGWITGQARPYDEISWLGRFTPRRRRSIWSKINTGIAEMLIKEGRMRAPGMREVEAAKKDGRWARAYNPPSTATLPEDFVKELSKSRRAKSFIGTIDRANLYAIVFRIENAKTPEKRREKIVTIVAMLEQGRTFHPVSGRRARDKSRG